MARAEFDRLGICASDVCWMAKHSARTISVIFQGYWSSHSLVAPSDPRALFYSSKVSNYTWYSFPSHLIAGLAVSEALCGLLKHLIVICWLQQDWFSISASWVTLLEYTIAYSISFILYSSKAEKNKCRKIIFLRLLKIKFIYLEIVATNSCSHLK